MASTASWTGILQLVRTRLLTFTSVSGGNTLGTRLGSTSSGSGSDGKLFLDQAPDDVTGFWAVLRLIDAPRQGTDGRLMIKGTLELQLFAHGRKNAAQVRAMADLVEEAWHLYVHTEVDGHLSAMGVQSRFPVPYEADPALREFVQIRLLLDFRCTPMFLLKYSAA